MQGVAATHQGTLSQSFFCPTFYCPDVIAEKVGLLNLFLEMGQPTLSCFQQGELIQPALPILILKCMFKSKTKIYSMFILND